MDASPFTGLHALAFSSEIHWHNATFTSASHWKYGWFSTSKMQEEALAALALLGELTTLPQAPS
jgi:hypothetical protein